MNYVIEVRVDKIVTGTIGPFENEAAADRYVNSFLEPNLKKATFHITDIMNPLDFLAILLEQTGLFPSKSSLAPIRPLSYFEDKYGPDFKHKLPLYRTAHLRGQAVSIVQLDMRNLEAMVVGVDGKAVRCNVRELDNFVL